MNYSKLRNVVENSKLNISVVRFHPKQNKKPTLLGWFFCLMQCGKMTKPMH